MKQTLLALIALCLSTGNIASQCKVGKETNEAKLLAYYAAPLAFSPSGMLERMSAGRFRAGFEITYIPEPGDELRQTSQCFRPKEENSQLSSILPRPRVALGLPGGFFLEGTYLPPITVADATPNMGSVAVGFVRQLRAPWSLAFRAHGTFGHVEGPITCPTDALQLTNPDLACYGGSKSKDTYWPNILGFESALTWNGAGQYAGYAGAGYTALRPRFRVGFQPANTGFDSTRVEVNLTRLALFLGGRYRLSRKIDVTGELYSVPKDLTTVRLGAGLAIP